jgi:hypothetical protein
MAALAAPSVFAGPAPEPKIERPRGPFAELPMVLFYESFEGATTAFKNGKVDAETVQFPNTHSFKLQEADWGRNDKWVYGYVENTVPFPAGLDPNDVHIQFSIWSDDPSLELLVRLKNGDFEDKPRLPKPKTWCPIAIKLNDTTKDKKRPTKDSSFTRMEFGLKPRDKNKLPNVFIDDVIVTTGVKPAMVLPRVAAAAVKSAAATRTADKDGFSFSPQAADALEAAYKPFKGRQKARTVVVIGGRGKDTEELIKGMTAAAPKVKATGFSLLPAPTPDTQPVVGLDGMRTLLPYAIHKTDAECVLLVLSFADSQAPGRSTDAVRVAMDRAFEMGCIPIVCLPAAPGNISKQAKTKLDGLTTTVTNFCNQHGLPWMDAATCAKKVEKAMDGNELNAAGVEAVAGVAMEAIKHLDTQFFKRK